MEPHHHVHVSTGFAFVVALFLVALVGIIVWAIVATRRPKVIERVVERRGETIGAGAKGWVDPPIYAQGYASAPIAPAPVVVNAGSSDGLLTGLVLGEMLARPSVIEERTVVEPAYVDAPVFDPGFTYDDGPIIDSASFGDAGGFDLDF